MTTYHDWQLDQLGCDCSLHRYHVAHLCTCGKLLSHSQADWDAHREHEMLNFDPARFYKHGDSFVAVFDRLQIAGLVPFGTNAADIIYAQLAFSAEQ